jgi:hypothetical protein
MNFIYLILLILSIYLSMTAGLADLRQRRSVAFAWGKKTYHVSTSHLWHDSLYLLLLIIALKVAF